MTIGDRACAAHAETSVAVGHVWKAWKSAAFEPYVSSKAIINGECMLWQFRMNCECL